MDCGKRAVVEPLGNPFKCCALISLHADNTKKNRQKRLHITLQSSWSADKAMQMLGRTHRTNQAHPPEYLMVASDVGGEKRFISTIAKRLGSLGALTRGSREAAGATSDAISKVNFDSTEGRRAADAFYTHLLRNPVVIQGVNPDQLDHLGAVTGYDILRQMSVLHTNPRTGEVSVLDGDRQNVNRLLNRLLALDPDIQNAAYDLYYDFFEQEVARALEDGTLDVGVRQLHGERPRILERNVLATDDQTGAETIHYVLETQVRQQRTSPAELEQLAQRHKDGRLYQVKTHDGREYLAFAWPAPDIVHANGRIEKAFYVVRPDRGRQKIADSRFHGTPPAQHFEQRRLQLERRMEKLREDVHFYRNLSGRSDDYYAKEAERRQAELDETQRELAELSGVADPEAEGRRRWQETFEATPAFAPERHNLLGGTVLKWWGLIQDAGVQGIFSAQDHETGERIVGVEVAAGGFRSLVDRIAAGRSTVTPRQVWSDVLNNGTPYQLAHGVRLAQIAEFGQDNQVIARHIRRIAETGGNADWVQKAVDRITGYATQADSKAERVSRMLRALQGFKLYLAAIPNSTQGVMNSLLAADLPAVAIGVRAALGRRGKRLAVESGATIDPVLHESVRELSGSSRALEHFLRAVGFTATERFNRVVAANVGAAYAQRMLDKLRANPGYKLARRLLLDLGIDAEAALQRGRLTGDDVLMAAKRFSDMTQFRSRAEDHPEWASTPWGKVLFQFKTFPYGQTKLLYRTLVDEARRGREFAEGRMALRFR